MPNPQKPTVDQVPASEHLSVRPDDGRPPELRFMFESPTQSRVGSAFGASIISHAAFIGLWVFILWLVPDNVREAVLPDEFPLSMFYEALSRKLSPVIASTKGITG